MKKVFLIFMLMATVANAETYKWTDKEGTIHFSDSLGSVPTQFRKRAVPLGIDTKGSPAENRVASAAEPVSAPDTGSVLPQVEGLKQRMMNDDGIMALVTAMQDDPDMQAILNDPAVLRAVQSGDVKSLERNPAFMKLLSNPRVREIEKRLKVEGER